MKILWICNVAISRIYEIKKEKNKNYIGGWLDGMSDTLLQQEKISLFYCYPNYQTDNLCEVHKDNFYSYGIPMKYQEATETLNESSSAVDYFKMILKKIDPDVIHFWGTEFLYSLEFYKAAKAIVGEDKNKIVVSIQGLVSVCAKHYEAGIPTRVMRTATLSELKGRCSLQLMKKSFLFRGEKEEELLRNVKYVIGRTSWDEACTSLLNPEVTYYKCNESLRNTFYNGQWIFEKCNPHQIFISQASYPIKGFHKVLEAVNLIKEFYPDILIKVAGQNVFNGNKIKGNTYGNYINNLIKKYKLEHNVEFVGMIDAEKMKTMLLESNVFVCPSSIENSPNSLGEAMLLGLPCIASAVGGCSDMMKHEVEGLIYPFNESYKLAYYLKKIFDDIPLASKLGEEARKKALITHDREKNNKILCDIYREIINKNISL